MILTLNIEESINLKEDIQKKVSKIAQIVQNIYKNKCNQKEFTCPTKSYNYCQGTAQRYCLQNFPAPPKCQNTVRYSLKTGVRIPNSITNYDMPDELKYFICKTAQPEFENLLEDIIKENNNNHAWTYFASSQGVLRSCPAKKASKQKQTLSCKNYDPRLRRWYAESAFKRKKMIILIENSRRIHKEPNRQISIQFSIQALLKSSQSYDYFNIIQFSDVAQPIFSKKQLKLVSLNQMIQNFQSSKNNNFQNVYEEITARFSRSNSTTVNYHKALKLAMNILQNSKDQNSDYQNLILMFAGFQPSNYSLNITSQLSQIIKKKGKQSNLSAKFFGFGVNMNSQKGANILKSLSCRFKGIYFDLSDIIYQSMFLDQAKGYYEYLIQGNQVYDFQWSDFYQDRSGLGQVTTITKAAYYQENNITYFIGIAGIDILTSQLQLYFNQTEDMFDLHQLDQKPFRENISFCVLQTIRRKHKCSKFCSITSNCQNKLIPENHLIFQKAIDVSQEICCFQIEIANQNGIIIGVCLASIFVMTIVVFTIYYIIRKKQKQQEDRKQNYKKIFETFNNFDQTRIRSNSQISEIKQ